MENHGMERKGINRTKIVVYDIYAERADQRPVFYGSLRRRELLLFEIPLSHYLSAHLQTGGEESGDVSPAAKASGFAGFCFLPWRLTLRASVLQLQMKRSQSSGGGTCEIPGKQSH